MKKLMKFFVLISMMLIMFLFAVQASASELPGISADVNFDGAVNAIDMITIKKILVNLEVSFEAADINLDGKVNAKDALFVTKVIKDEISLENELNLSIYSTDRHAYQNFLSDMTFENISEGEGVWGTERITFISESTYEYYCELYHYEESGNLVNRIYNDSVGVRVGFIAWPVYKEEIEVLSDPIMLRNLFLEHGIELPRYPTTVCMIDTEGCDPVYWIKCGNEDYFIKYKWIGELLDNVFDPCTKEEFVEYAREEKATVIINGVEIEDEHAVVGSQYCLVSMTNLLEAMGAEVNWVTDTDADINYNGKNFVLVKNYGDFCFYETEERVDFFEVFGGGTVVESIDHDLLIDDLYMSLVISALENDGVYNRFTDVDYENKIISITYNVE